MSDAIKIGVIADQTGPGGRPISEDQIAADHRVVAESVVALGRKESSDADDPHDHSVANAITSFGASTTRKESS